MPLSAYRRAAAFLFMAFTYQFGANPPIDYPRFLVSDTVDVGHIFEDSEIVMATIIQGMVWQSSQFYSGTGGQQNLPNPPVSYRRVAATLLDALASSASRMNAITQLLDVKLDPSKAVTALRDQARAYRMEDDEGAFVVIEQTATAWAWRDRWFNQIQRQGGV